MCFFRLKISANVLLYSFFFTACSVGLFGSNCDNKCSSNCRGVKSCNRMTGTCDEGCIKGWSGAQCETGTYILYFNYIIIYKKMHSFALEHCKQQLLLNAQDLIGMIYFMQMFPFFVIILKISIFKYQYQ